MITIYDCKNFIIFFFVVNFYSHFNFTIRLMNLAMLVWQIVYYYNMIQGLCFTHFADGCINLMNPKFN